MSPLAKTITFTVVGTIVVALGIGTLFVFQNVLHSEIKQVLPIANGSLSYTNWVTPPADVYLQFWLFDVLNAYEFTNYGAKPMLQERGPYSYREIREKTNITFHSNGTVTYRDKRTMVFDEEKSNGKESDKITTLNMPLSGFGIIAKNLVIPKSLRTLVEKAMQTIFVAFKEDLLMEYTVSDIIWGYSDNLLKDIKTLFDWLHTHLHIAIPSGFDGKFGLFMDQNGSNDGLYTVYTGEGDINKFNIISKWNYESELPYWHDVWSNMINGTDGTMYHPFIKQTEKLEIFSSDICRSIDVEYTANKNIKDIDLYHFEPPDNLFSNISVNANNRGFCMPDVDHCLDSGLLNISHCKQGASVIMSLPHFLFAAPKYLNAVDGLHPDKKEHGTELDIEPISGTVMHANKRLQINIGLEHVDNIKGMDKLTDTLIFPILWLNESATITDSAANQFKNQFLSTYYIVNTSAICAIILGGLLLFCSFIYALYSWFSKKHAELQLLINRTDNNTSYDAIES